MSQRLLNGSKEGVDQLLEDYANDNGEIRSALTPSVLQLVGAKGSKDDDTVGETRHPIYHFEFELHDWKSLRQEHLRTLAVDLVMQGLDNIFGCGL